MVIHVLEDLCKRRLASGQVITSLTDAVKELLENALDADASSISIILYKDGWDKIIVKDNGSGVPIDGRQGMALRYHTSKISAFDDLESIETLGFRGEALNSICAISKSVTLTTKTSSEATATIFEFDVSGDIQSSRSSSAQQGTTVEIRNIFHNTPVRRQHGRKLAKTNTRRIKELLVRYSMVRPNVRFAMTTKNGSSESTTTFPSSDSALSRVASALGTDTSAACMHFASEMFELVLPKCQADSVAFKHSPVFSINKRPVTNAAEEIKTLLKILKEEYAAVSRSDVNKAPFALVSISLPSNTYDVNVEPSKNRVLFHNLQALEDSFAKVLREAWARKKQAEKEQDMVYEAYSNINDMTPVPSTKAGSTYIAISPQATSPTTASPSSIYTRESNSPFVRNMFDSIGDEDLEISTAMSEDDGEGEVAGDDISSTSNPWTLAKMVMSSVSSTPVAEALEPRRVVIQSPGHVAHPLTSSNQSSLSFNTTTLGNSSPSTAVSKARTTKNTSSSPIKTHGIVTYLSTHNVNTVCTPPKTPNRRYLLSAPYRAPKRSAIDTLNSSVTVSCCIKPRTLSSISMDPICEPRPYTCKFPSSTPAWTFTLSDIDIQRIENNIIARMDSKAISICTFQSSQIPLENGIP